MAGDGRRFAAAVVVAALLIQAAAVPATAQSAGQPAEEVYVNENGDAFLVYESEPSDDDPDSVEFGASVDENLVYGLVTDSPAGTPDVRANLSARAIPTELQAAGNLSFPNPDGVRDFALDVHTESTEETSTSDVSLDTTFADESGLTGFLDAVDTSGDLTLAADRLTAAASLDVRTNLPLGERQSLALSIAETADGYEADVDWSRPVPEPQAEQWRTSDDAERILQAQFQSIADGLGGSASVDVDDVSVSENTAGYRLDQAYTVRFTGVESGIESAVRAALAEDPQVTAEQVDRLASAISAVEVRELDIDYAVEARDLTGEISLDVRGYDDLALAYFETVQAVGPGTVGDALDRAQAQYEAQQAADLEQHFGWNASLTHPESGITRAQLAASARATNWAEYVTELRNRDVPFVSQAFHLSGAVEDSRMAFNGSASMAGEDLFEMVMQGVPTGEEVPDESAAILESIEESNPKRAKLVGSNDNDGLRIEAGAEFGDLASIRDALAENADVPGFAAVVGRANETGGRTVVRVPGAISGTPTEERVRSLSGVGADTTVHLPGEWDRAFPSMDVERARNFLSDDGAGSSGPGFGILVAVVALMAAAGVLGRRRGS